MQPRTKNQVRKTRKKQKLVIPAYGGRLILPQQQRPPQKRLQQQNMGGGVPGRMSTAPVSRQKTIRTGRPKIESMRNGDCRIRHREYIQDIAANNATPSTFAISAQIAVNPGLAISFPWLSKIAQNFESYIFEKLIFDYETEAPSSLGGTNVMALDYNALDLQPFTKQEALALRGSVRSAPWNPCSHISLREDLHKQKSYFVRNGAPPAASDLKTYDVGNLFVVTQGVTTANAVCGELYVEYDILLKTPVYEPFINQGALVNHDGTGMSTTDYMGTTDVEVAFSNLQLKSAGLLLSVDNLQVGHVYGLTTVMTSSGSGLTGTISVAATSGCTAGVNIGSPVVTANAALNYFTFTATNQLAVMTYSGLTLVTTPDFAFVSCAELAIAI